MTENIFCIIWGFVEYCNIKSKHIEFLERPIGLVGKDYIDFDRTVLAKQLEHTVSDLHWVTRVHQKVQEEKNMLEKKLFEAENNNRMQLEHIEELKVSFLTLFQCCIVSFTA